MPDRSDEPRPEVELHGPAAPRGGPPTAEEMRADHDRLVRRISEVIDGRIGEALTAAAHDEKFQGELTRAAVVPAAAAGAAAARSPADTLGFGWAKTVVNLSAAAIVFVLFWNSQSAQQAQFIELVRNVSGQGQADRQMYQSALGVAHEDSQRKWAAIERNTAGVMTIQTEMRQSRELIRAQNDVLAELVKAVRGERPRGDVRPPPPPPAEGPGNGGGGWFFGAAAALWPGG
jgi:hypothetical protein